MGAFIYEAFMAFHFHSPDQARAKIYDAALLLLQADHALALQSFSIQTIAELGEVCWRIEHGKKLSKSPLLSI